MTTETNHNTYRNKLIVFLDVDGVLNTSTPSKDTIYFHPRTLFLRISLLKNLIELHKEFNFFVVLSSYWRINDTSRKIIINILKYNNILTIDLTPIFNNLSNVNHAIIRTNEIKDWVGSNKIKKWIALDDLPLLLNPKHFVHTYFNHGLTLEKKNEFEKKAKNLLF